VSFQALARLLLPADGRRSLVVETGPRWSWEAAPASKPDIMVWGRGPAPSGTPTRVLAAMALARERALVKLKIRPPRPYRVTAVHRWPPAKLRAGSARNRIREVLLGGAIVELATGDPPPRVLDAAARAAGFDDPVRRFGAGSGGSALATLRDGSGRHVLRVAGIGQPADPAHAAEALERLASLGIDVVPQVRGRGRVLTASWTLETRLPGRRPARVSATIARQVAAVCRQLPRASGGPTALRQDLDRIAAAIPDRRRPLMDLSETVSGRLARLPLVMRHGDLWAGNLLVSGDRLTGIVDWDSWHAAAAPGIDLLHLLAADTALRTKREIGEVWLDRPWRSEAFALMAADYWAAIGDRPTAGELDAVGVAWWAAEIGHALELAPEQAQDRRWVGLNVEAVLGSLA
jgi:Phosphotransferase enzyme family